MRIFFDSMRKAGLLVVGHGRPIERMKMPSATQHQNYVHPPRNPALVQKSDINIMALPVYVPPKHEPVRPGADDHLKYGSLKCLG